MKALLIGNHIMFAREGETIDSVTVGRDAKPETVPASNWTPLGTVRTATIDNQKQEIEIWGPAPGRMVLQDVLMGRQDLRIRCTLEEVSTLMYEMVFGSVQKIDISQGGAFVPLAKRSWIKGWFKFQQFNQRDELVSVVDLWARASIQGTPEFGDQSQNVTWELELRALYSPLASGLLGNL